MHVSLKDFVNMYNFVYCTKKTCLLMCPYMLQLLQIIFKIFWVDIQYKERPIYRTFCQYSWRFVLSIVYCTSFFHHQFHCGSNPFQNKLLGDLFEVCLFISRARGLEPNVMYPSYDPST